MYILWLLNLSLDYNPGPFYVTFPANQTSVSFDISLNDDNKVEKDEKFLLELHNPHLPYGVKLQDHSCLVTIIDTTSKSLIHICPCSVYILKY